MEIKESVGLLFQKCPTLRHYLTEDEVEELYYIVANTRGDAGDLITAILFCVGEKADSDIEIDYVPL
jgi:hypothetical protein